MQKHKKPSKSKLESSPLGEQDTYDLAFAFLRKQIVAVVDGSAPETKHDPAYRVATLTKMMAEVDAERRKARAAENKRLERITRPLVIAWARTLDPDEQRSIVRELVALGQEGSILA